MIVIFSYNAIFIIKGEKIFELALVLFGKSLYHYREQEIKHIQLPYGDSALRYDGHITSRHKTAARL